MTKLQLQFKLANRLTEGAMSRLADTSSLYGILGLKVDPALDGVTVEFDATRLREKDVRAALARAGLPVTSAQ